MMLGKVVVFFEKLTKLLKKTEKNRTIAAYHRHLNKDLDNRKVLLEASHGLSLYGSILYIAEELVNTRHEVVVAVREVNAARAMLSERGMSSIKVVEWMNTEYAFHLATAKYLVNDTSFLPFFIKQNGQVYINTWHGTPLKKLGIDVENPVSAGNVMKNFLLADYIVSSNSYTSEKLIGAYQLDGIYNGKMVTAPSPRNSILYGGFQEEKIKAKYASGRKGRIIVYMPTWRESKDQVSRQVEIIQEGLQLLSESLGSDDVIICKLHYKLSSRIQVDADNVVMFPEGGEVYEMLSVADLLITDYSSVMFDFCGVGRPVVLFCYDKKDYLDNRGVYFDIDELSFDQASSPLELVEVVASNLMLSISHENEARRFCPVDCLEGSKIFVDYFFNGIKSGKVKEEIIGNGKENVGILSGGLWDNGVTSALYNLLQSVDASKRNYIIFFGKNKVSQENSIKIHDLPQGVKFYPIFGSLQTGMWRQLFYNSYYRWGFLKGRLVDFLINSIAKKEYQRTLGCLSLDHFVHYTGYDRKYAILSRVATGKSYIFVHSDMFKEYETRRNYNKKIVFEAYKRCEKIVLVNPLLKQDFVTIFPSLKEKVFVSPNFLGEERVKEKSLDSLLMTFKSIPLLYMEKRNFKLSFPVNGNEVGFVDLVVSGLLDIELSSYLKIRNLKEVKKLREYVLPLLLVRMKGGWDSKQAGELVTDNLSGQLTFPLLTSYIINSENIGAFRKHCEAELEKTLESEFGFMPFDMKKFLINLDGCAEEILQSPSEDFFLAVESWLSEFMGRKKADLLENLLDKSTTFFVNVARFSPEKGQERLIAAFEKAADNSPKARLLLIGPYGPTRNELISLSRQSRVSDRIYILGGAKNPHPIVKQCDCFVLSSYYEALGLVVYEAKALGKDVITVDISGTTKYLDDSAIVVENSTVGIEEGISGYLEGKEHPAGVVSFEKYRKESVEAFERIFH